jgi:hypothetical protein
MEGLGGHTCLLQHIRSLLGLADLLFFLMRFFFGTPIQRILPQDSLLDSPKLDTNEKDP